VARPLTTLAALILAAGAGGAAGQGLTGVALTISQSVEADTNYRLVDDSPGTSYFGDTRFALDLTSETETQIFTLGIDTGARALWQAEEDFEFTFADPSTARAAYGQEWADSSLDAFLRYQQSDLDTVGVVGDFDAGAPIFPDDLSRFSGTRQRYDGGFALALATDAPSSYRLEINATQIDFKDVPTGEEDQSIPTTNVTANALWTLRLTSVLSSQVLANYEINYVDDAAATEIETAGLDAGLTYAASEVLSVTAGIGYADRERTEKNARGQRITSQSDSGPEIRGLVRYELPYGALEANARLTTAAPETRLTGDLIARYDLARGAIRASAYQNYNLDNDGDETLQRGFGLGIVREINSRSQLGFDLALATEINEDDGSAPDTNRFDATATYGVELTEAVSANLGYRLRLREEGSGYDANSNAVFFSVGRTFATAP
jgi:hypothetical protein